ncbi:ATP-binding cassette domain-containing protein [Confluentibacter flavum]|uniref:ABC transporter n=1 Tax=Confluentibacter flavum TaxID=1909700 RepID=A0A2N3HMG4_9FLAO|nr:ATP-binding cassette domain-containing protein [Confluentibacter flavum]PKQ46146.1 ABC transporter [Confluentibacter flavum]
MDIHNAIYISNNEDKHQLIDRIIDGGLFEGFSKLKGALFSEITLNQFIEEEIIHEHFDVVTNTKNSLQKSSEGERKKALLNHLILQNPEYLIADNVFGNLDTAAQADIQQTLKQLSFKIPIIQIINRMEDLLSFINKIYRLEDNSLVLIDNINSLKTNANNLFIESLPKHHNSSLKPIYKLVTFKNVSVKYNDRPILNAIHWEIKSGEFWQLIGPNGSGKSTMLSMITGDNPKAFLQDITLFGMKKGSGETVWDIKKHIGYFSSDMLRGFMRSDSIENMIISGFFDSIGLYKFPLERQTLIAHQWLRILNMYDIKEKNFLSLSNGHQRLVLIARAMVKQPPLLILDEPTNGLDDVDAQLFIQLINKIALESDTAILYVSHRHEVGLKPDFIYELVPSESGSIGREIET